MLETSSPPVLRYASAILLVALAAILTHLQWPLVDPHPTSLFFAAVLVTAWYGGRGPGLLATALSALVIESYFEPPSDRFSLDWSDIVRIGVFVLTALLINWLSAGRKRALTTLKRRERELTDFIENAAVGLHWVGPDGRILWANKAELEIVDYPAEEYIGHHISEFHADKEAIDEILARLTNGETVTEYEARLRRKDGAIRHVLISSNVYWEGERFVHTKCFTRDVTARKQAEEALRESERRFTMFMEHLPGLAWIKDLNGRYVYANDAAVKAFRKSRVELYGKSDVEIFPAETAVQFQQNDRRALESGTGVQAVETLEQEDGLHHSIVSKFPIAGPGGEAAMVGGVAFDITDRKHAEETAAFLALIVESSDDAIISKDLSGRITSWNRGAEELYGYSAAEAVGKPISIIMPPERREEMTEILERIKRGERIEHFETVRLTRNGERVDVSLTVSPVRDSLGKIIGASKIARDITGRKRAEAEREQLLAREQVARAEAERLLQESIKLAALYRDLAGSLETHEVTSTICRAVRDLIGADGATFVLHEGEEVYYADENAIAPLWKGQRFPVSSCISGWSILERQPAVVEDIYSDKRIPSEAYRQTFVKSLLMVPVRSINPVGAIGAYWATPHRASEDEVRLMQVVASAADLSFTNAKLYEQMKQARLEAEEASRLKDEFLATISHELRTPLTAIVGWTHMLRRNQLDQQAAASALSTIERNARSQTQLIEDLLDVSRIITGKLRLDVRPFEPAAYIETAIEALRPAAEAKAVRIQKVMDTGVGMISGDPNRLQQVVWNLLSNAIKFTPKGGRVQLRLERVNSHIEISVSDTGVGIRPEFLPFVFDRFRQADGTTTRSHGGLGLGLAIVRHLVEMHGGTVTADSPGENQGATFIVKLPLLTVYPKLDGEERVHPRASDQPLPLDCPESLEGMKVLVVDDETDTRDLLKAVLSQCGAEVVTAGSSREALELLPRVKPDVLVSDIGMPGEDGYELIKRVRALPAESGGRTPAVALTAYARSEDRLRVLRSGYQMHVPKPVEMAELVTILANLAER
jgi:PAS domain S-box-containing protein